MSLTYQIFPRTTVQGTTIESVTPQGETNDISLGACRCLCDERDDCVGFTINKTTGKDCKLKSTNEGTAVNTAFDGYLKGGRSSYIILWMFVFTLVLFIFLAISNQHSNSPNAPYYTNNFS